ncbi:DUF4314 domain-containing protein [Dactylosporangium cerinum]|uniref:DUF4314 domain-containing protein n=1 Tax=Dactylosporangium cerinum TaxID=1434730 RepID=A0ABV9VQA8_9ACTN
MVYYRPGDRVELVRTTDVLTELRPGDQGVVTRFDFERHMVYIDWDGGSRLSMCLDAGDQIRTIRSITSVDGAVDAEPFGAQDQGTGQAEDVVRAPLHAGRPAQNIGAVLRRLDRTGLDTNDLVSLAWIIDRVDRRASLERIEGNLSSVGQIAGVVISNPATVSEVVDICTAYLQVQLVPSGDRVLWSLNDLIAAQQQECLFELA